MEGIAAIPVGKLGGMFALVDLEDLERVLARKWRFDGEGRAVSGGECVKLHRFVLGNPQGVVCHLNGDVLDCRKGNLMVADQHVNALQRHAGGARRTVGIDLDRGRWRAFIDNRPMGRFHTRVEAALVRDFVVRAKVGMVATYNFAVAPELPFQAYCWAPAPPEQSGWQPMARIARRSLESVPEWYSRKTAVFAVGGPYSCVIRCGPGWPEQERGEGTIEATGLRVGFLGGAIHAWANSVRWRSAHGALRGLVDEPWYMAWRADGKLRVRALWGEGAEAFEVGVCRGRLLKEALRVL